VSLHSSVYLTIVVYSHLILHNSVYLTGSNYSHYYIVLFISLVVYSHYYTVLFISLAHTLNMCTLILQNSEYIISKISYSSVYNSAIHSHINSSVHLNNTHSDILHCSICYLTSKLSYYMYIALFISVAHSHMTLFCISHKHTLILHYFVHLTKTDSYYIAMNTSLAYYHI
jgi:hypothetical protein